MGEQNPSELPAVHESITVSARMDPDRWGEFGGALRLGHWMVVTIYRFPDERNHGAKGGALPLSGKGDNSAREYGVQGMFSRQVFAFKTESAMFEPGVWEETQYVGPIKSVRTSKKLGAGSGSFTIIAKPFGEWAPLIAEQSPDADERLGVDNSIHKYLDSGDWIEIVVYKSDPRVGGTPIRTVLVGKVDGVALTVAPAHGGTGNTIRIDGRDAGAVYEDTILYFNPYDPLHSNPDGRDLANILATPSGRPAEIVEQFLNLVAVEENEAFGIQARVPDAGLWTSNPYTEPVPFSDVVITQVGPTRGIVFDPAMITPGQNTPLWSFVGTYGVTELNEYWVDVDPFEAGPKWAGDNRFVYVTMREKPFVNITDGLDSAWFSLRPNVINCGEIKSANLNRGQSRYNYLNVLVELPATMNYDAFVLCEPVFNLKSIERHGLLKLDLSLNIQALGQGDDMDALLVSAEIKEIRDLILQWNLLNPHYYSGQIVIQGNRADIRVGQRIVVCGGPVPHLPNGPFTGRTGDFDPNSYAPAPGLFSAYVEGVDMSWAAGQTPECTTTVSVSRGYRDDQRLADMKALFSEWSGAVTAASGEMQPVIEASGDDGVLP